MVSYRKGGCLLGFISLGHSSTLSRPTYTRSSAIGVTCAERREVRPSGASDCFRLRREAGSEAARSDLTSQRVQCAGEIAAQELMTAISRRDERDGESQP